MFEHDLDTDEEGGADDSHQGGAGDGSAVGDPPQDGQEAVEPNGEADQVGGHHHEDVEGGAQAAEDAVGGGSGFELGRREY